MKLRAIMHVNYFLSLRFLLQIFTCLRWQTKGQQAMLLFITTLPLKNIYQECIITLKFLCLTEEVATQVCETSQLKQLHNIGFVFFANQYPLCCDL